jgi:PAS domain S-box-containing protein
VHTLVPLEREVSTDERYYLMRLSPYRTTDDYIDGVVITFVDLTVRQQAEQALHQSEAETRLLLQLHQTIMANMGEGVFTLDAQGRVTYLNPEAERLLGWKTEELLGRRMHDMTHYQRPDGSPFPIEECAGFQVLREGKALKDFADTFIRKDASFFPVSYSSSLLRDANGQVVGLVVVFQDITERKQAEQERHHLEARLRQVEKLEAIGTLAGGIAHEFNNILAGLLGFTTLLQLEVPPESRAGSYVQQVRQAGQRAKELVQQIVTFSHTECSSKEPLPLDQVVHEALTLLRASLPSTIDIQCHLSEPGMMVLASRTQLHGVVMNLGANADYVMRESGGRLTVGIEPVEIDAAFAAAHPPLSPGPHVCLSMDDTGSGMIPAVMAHIFEPFFTTKPIGQGTGMGLAMVHGIVTSHGGTLTVASTQGVGTRFAIYLPRIDVPVVPAGGPELPLPPGKGCVLLVDDEETVAQVLGLLLESLGYDAVVHTTSHDALAAFRTTPHRFDVVITDQTMPQMTGEDLIHTLRQIRSDIPVILCTGFSHIMDAEKAQVLGNVAFLMKPVDEHELAVRLQQMLAPKPAKTSSVLKSA